MSSWKSEAKIIAVFYTEQKTESMHQMGYQRWDAMSAGEPHPMLHYGTAGVKCWERKGEKAEKGEKFEKQYNSRN